MDQFSMMQIVFNFSMVCQRVRISQQFTRINQYNKNVNHHPILTLYVWFTLQETTERTSREASAV